MIALGVAPLTANRGIERARSPAIEPSLPAREQLASPRLFSDRRKRVFGRKRRYLRVLYRTLPSGSTRSHGVRAVEVPTPGRPPSIGICVNFGRVPHSCGRTRSPAIRCDGRVRFLRRWVVRRCAITAAHRTRTSHPRGKSDGLAGMAVNRSSQAMRIDWHLPVTRCREELPDREFHVGADADGKPHCAAHFGGNWDTAGLKGGAYVSCNICFASL